MPRRLYLLAIAIVLVPLSLMADDVTLTLSSPGNNPSGSYYASPYQATVQGTGQVLTVYCIDFDHDVSLGQTWDAVIQPLTQTNIATTSQEGSPDPVNPLDPNAWRDYSIAAFLIDDLIQAPSAYWQAVYQYAAWAVFLPYGNTSAMIATDTTNYNSSVSSAEAQYGTGLQFAKDVAAAYVVASTAVQKGYTPLNFDLVTPTPQGLSSSVQEFLVKVPPVPEPSSIILLLTAAFAAVLVIRKRSGARV
jgi:PEP-CTERM motif